MFSTCLFTFFFAVACSTVTLVSAQLTGPVGPMTSPDAKRSTICNVLDYGGSVGSSDIGPAINSAFINCVRKNVGSTLYVPPGNYSMATLLVLNKGSQWAFQLDGIITRTTTTLGHMIIIDNAHDFEFYSSTSAGAIQGNGYQCRNAGPRLLRIANSTRWSVHDVILVDSPEYHLIVDGGSGGEVYNIAIRGANIGGSDGIDVRGDNHWIHDVEITNRDECVTVKSPASNILVERVWCNQSGGCAIGSLTTGTTVENVLYRNIYTNGGNYFLMIKSNGGDGYVKNLLFQNFTGSGTAYGLDVDQYWYPETTAAGNGVQLSNVTFQGWNGIVVNGVQRPPIRFACADGAPCIDMVLDNVNMWSTTGKVHHACRSAWGLGACLQAGAGGSYAMTTVSANMSAAPGNIAKLSLPGDLAAGFPDDAPIPIPSIPTTFYPGLPQISPLAVNN